jgi:hypothetical protein
MYRCHDTQNNDTVYNGQIAMLSMISILNVIMLFVVILSVFMLN